MNTYRIFVRGHKAAALTFITMLKRGDGIAVLDAQIRDAGMDPSHFGVTSMYDTKTDDHAIAHELLTKARARMSAWQLVNRGPAPPLFNQGGGPQTAVPLTASAVTSSIANVLHATTNRSAGGERKGPGARRGGYSYAWH